MFYIGCDLGQSHDPSAVAVVQRVGDYFRCGHLERLPLGTPYPAVVGRVQWLMGHPAVAGNVKLAIDASGVGRPIADLFTAVGVPFIGVIITGGTEESNPGGNYRHVPKLTLISHVQALLHEGKLKIRKDMPEAANLVAELQDFKVNYSAAGYMSFSARQGKHDDLVLALAIAIWSARRTLTGPESWAEFLERGDWRRGTADGGSPSLSSELNWSTSSEPLLRVFTPPALGLSSRFIEGKPYIEVTRSEAKERLKHPVWAELNQALCRELFDEKEEPTT